MGMGFKRFGSLNAILRPLALWLGIVALTVQGLAPLCLAGMMPQLSGVTSIILCTAHGFQTVRLDAGGKPLPAAPDQNQQNSPCPLCAAAHMANGFTAPVLFVLAQPVVRGRENRLAVSSPAFPLRTQFPYVTRAPPAPSFS